MNHPELNIDEQLQCLRLMYEDKSGVQYWSRSRKEWKDWDVWSCAIYPRCHPGVESPTILRLKPTKKFVPWTQDTCPLGTQVQEKNSTWTALITAKNSAGAILGRDSMTWYALFQNYVRMDGTPCGTEESNV